MLHITWFVSRLTSSGRSRGPHKLVVFLVRDQIMSKACVISLRTFHAFAMFDRNNEHHKMCILVVWPPPHRNTTSQLPHNLFVCKSWFLETYLTAHLSASNCWLGTTRQPINSVKLCVLIALKALIDMLPRTSSLGYLVFREWQIVSPSNRRSSTSWNNNFQVT